MPAQIWLALLPLAGTIVGACATYLATRYIEERRWQQRKHDLRKQVEREAITHAYEVSSPVNQLLWGMLGHADDPEAYMKRITDAFNEVSSKMEIAALSLSVLSPELREPAWGIVRQITQLGPSAWRANHLEIESDEMEKLKEKLFAILDAIVEWRTSLQREYSRTFE